MATGHRMYPLTLIRGLKREARDLKENIPFYPIISPLGRCCSAASFLLSEKLAATFCSLQRAGKPDVSSTVEANNRHISPLISQALRYRMHLVCILVLFDGYFPSSIDNERSW